MNNYMKVILSAVKTYIDKIAAKINNAIPTKVSELENDSNYLKNENVPDWAKEETKPSYTVDEIDGAVTKEYVDGKETIVQPFPVIRIDELVPGYIKAAIVNVLDLKKGNCYCLSQDDLNKMSDVSNPIVQLSVVCDDGTIKNLVGNNPYSCFVTPIGIMSSGDFMFYTDRSFNTTYSVDMSDLTTANNVKYTIFNNGKYLGINNTDEFTPTSNYQPATKKYVDDSVSSISTENSSIYETKEDASAKLEEAKSYADQVKSDILGGAPKETLDTIAELATAFEENAEVVEAINQAITNKANVEHVHDWNEIKNKPFYGKLIIKEMVLEDRINDLRPASIFLAPLERKEYTMVIDGEKYVFTPVCGELDGEPYAEYFSDEFNILYRYGLPNDSIQSSCFIDIHIGEYPHTIELYEGTEGVKQFDDCYLSDNIARISDIDEKISNLDSCIAFPIKVTLNENGDFTSDKTFEEIEEAYRNNKELIVFADDIINSNERMSLYLYQEEYGVFIFKCTGGLPGGVYGVALLRIDKDNAIEPFVETVEIGSTNDLVTEDQTIVGSINELFNNFSLSFKEVGEVFDEINQAITNKADAEHVHSWNDLEDKPFYKEVVTPILETTTFEVVEETGSDFPLEISEEVAQAIRDNDGANVIVTFDGVEYNGQIHYSSVAWFHTIEIEGAALRLESGSTNLSIDASLDIGTHTIGISLGGGVKQIDREFVNLDGVVLYDEQELSEEQQMQARKNLGLYNSYTQGKILYDNYIDCNSGNDSIIEKGYDALSNQNIKILVYGDYDGSLLYEKELTYKDGSVYMAGYSYYYGNAGLAREYGYTCYGTDEDTGEPVLLIAGEGVPEDAWCFCLKESYLEKTDRVGAYRLVVLDLENQETVYETIPEEYIPGTIARKDEIPTVEFYSIENNPILPLSSLGTMNGGFFDIDLNEYITNHENGSLLYYANNTATKKIKFIQNGVSHILRDINNLTIEYSSASGYTQINIQYSKGEIYFDTNSDGVTTVNYDDYALANHFYLKNKYYDKTQSYSKEEVNGLISSLESKVEEGFEELTEAEVDAIFAEIFG